MHNRGTYWHRQAGDKHDAPQRHACEPGREVEHEDHANDRLRQSRQDLGHARAQARLQQRRVAPEPADDLAGLVLIKECYVLKEDAAV